MLYTIVVLFLVSLFLTFTWIVFFTMVEIGLHTNPLCVQQVKLKDIMP